MQRTCSSRILVPEKPEIKLTETEGSICELLDECVKFLENEKGIRTSCRVAGGWVRDKVNPYFVWQFLMHNKRTFSSY